jgi:hypothetical protein
MARKIFIQIRAAREQNVRMRFAVLLVFGLSLGQPVFAGLTWDTTFREIQVPSNQGEVLLDFGFKNKGTEPVEISSIQTSCGCTTAKVDSKRIAPGESGAVHVRYDVGGRKGTQVKGVIVQTSDHSKQNLTLRILIQEPVSFSQKEFVWSMGSPATPKDSIVAVAPGARIESVESQNDQFDARLEEMQPGVRYRIVVTPHSTEVAVDASIKVFVADPKRRSVLLQARVEN